MQTTIEQLIKDIVFNLQAYIYWFDEFKTEGLWEAQMKANNFMQRLEELLPQALEYFRNNE